MQRQPTATGFRIRDTSTRSFDASTRAPPFRARNAGLRSRRPRADHTDVKKRLPLTLLALAFAISISGPAHAATIIIQPPKSFGVDGYLASLSDSTKNYGKSKDLLVGDRDRAFRALFWFDMSALPPGTQINSAALDLYVDNYNGPNGNSAKIGAYRVRRAWGEGTGDGNATGDGATWYRTDGTGSWETPGGDFDSAATSTTVLPEVKDVRVQWDVTALAQNWVDDADSNLGVLLMLVDEAPSGSGLERKLVSNDGDDASKHPRLIIDYTLKSAKVTVIQPQSAASGFDTFIRSAGDAIKNYGKNASLIVGDETRLQRSLLRFDLSALNPNDEIDWATLDLYLDGSGGADTVRIDAHALSRVWTEGSGDGTVGLDGATWISANGIVGWTAQGGDFDTSVAATRVVPGATGAWYSWEITKLVEGWHSNAPSNRGVILRISKESAGANRKRTFRASDGATPSLFPRLTIHSTPAGAPAAVDSARAEITPNSAASGSSTLFTYSIQTFVSGTRTGVDRALVTIPPGFTVGGVTSVLVNLLPRAYTASIDPGFIRVSFASKIPASARIDILFNATPPPAYDSPSYAITSWVDDASTASPASACAEGSANINPLDANSWDVLVTSPGLLSLTILPASASLSADSSLDFNAVLTDLLGGTSSVEPTWGVTGSIGTISATGLFTPTTAGAGRVTGVYLGLRDSSEVTVSPGVPATVTISPASATVSADSTRQFAATVRDSDGNIVSTPVTWSVLGGIGTITTGGLFTATTAGTGNVRAAAGTAVGLAPVTVTAGAAVWLGIAPDSAAVSADSTQTFTATILDADGNTTIAPLLWTVAGGIGTISSGVFTATTAGEGSVIATVVSPVGSDSLGSPALRAPHAANAATALSDSARVRVVPGALRNIAVAPASATITSDSSLVFTATGTDQDGNTIPGFTPAWSVLGGIGSITPGGLFDAERTGNGRVVASNGGALPADSANVTVTMGSLVGVVILPSAATLSPGDTVSFALRARDADDNRVAIPANSVAWKTTDPTGSIDAAGLYTAGSNLSPPTYDVIGDYQTFSSSAAISIISSGSLVRVEIVDSLGADVDSLSLTADDDGLLLRALGYGSADEVLGPIPCTWSVLGDAGVIEIPSGPDIEASADFVLAGTARVRIAGPGGLSDTTGAIGVVAGALASIVVTPGPLSITTDTTIAFDASGIDEDGNAAAEGAITWSAAGGIGTIGALSGVFDPTTPGSGYTRATSSLGVSGDSPAITVSAGALASLVVSPSSATIPVGASQAFAAFAADADENALARKITWSVVGSAGSIDTAGVFTATSAGSAIVVAAGGGLADSAAVTVIGAGLRILAVSVPRPTVTEGQSGIPVTIRVLNESIVTLTAFVPVLAPSDSTGAPLPGSVSIEDAQLPGALAPGAEGVLTLTVGLAPSLAPGERVTLDASVTASDALGTPYVDAEADVTAEWLVEAAPRLVDAEDSVWPRRVARGASGVSLLLEGWNAGGVDVNLDPAATRLVFGDGGATYTSPLADALSLPRNASVVVLDFTNAPVPPAMTAGVYPLTLILAGEDANGKAYAETLVTAGTNEVTVLPPYVTVTPAPTGGGAARPGDEGLTALAFDIENGYPDTKTLESVTVRNVTIGPGTTAQRDGEIASVSLYRDIDENGVVSGGDALLGESSFSGASVLFDNLALAIASEARLRFVAAIDIGVSARDGDSLDLALASAAALDFAGSPTIDGIFPLNPLGRLVVDGSAAAQFAIWPVPPRALPTGEALATALDITIPANGYAADTLTALAIGQSGTAVAGADIAGVTLVKRSATSRAGAAARGGAASGAGAADSTIGEMVWTGARWIRTGMNVPIPPGGLRVAALATLSDSATEGSTILFEIPASEGAVSVRSGNDGPVDAALEGGGPLSVALANRIVVASTPVEEPSLPQGAQDAALLAFLVGNTYAGPETLSAIRLVSEATLLESDRVDSLFERVSLSYDADQSGAIEDYEPPIAAGVLSDGDVVFEDLAIEIAPGQSAYLVAAGDVSTRARDGDLIRVIVPAREDLAFRRALAIEGSFPLASAAERPVAGMTLATLANHGAPPRVVPPGERDVLLLDATIPPNGYEPDRLLSFRVENEGTGSAGVDLDALRLYADDGDGAFASEADSLVGALSFVGSGWLIDGLDLEVGEGGARLFVAADVAAAPNDSATITLRVPEDGIAMESPNDGPIDGPLVNAFTQTISTSPLLVSMAFERRTASLGQEIELRASLENAGDVAIDGITPALAGPTGSGAATMVSGPSPDSLSLDPAEMGAFVWRVQTTAIGAVTFVGSARGRERGSEAEISSTPIPASLLTIVNPPSTVSLFPVDLAPPTVVRGTTDVVPMSLTFAVLGAPPFASAEIRALTLEIDDGAGGAIAPRDLASRVAVREASTLFHATDSLGASATIRLELDTPIVVSPEDPVTIAIALDIRGDSRVGAYRLSLLAPEAGDVVDANSGAPVALALESGAFPVRTGRTTVTARPTELSMSIESIAPPAMNRGQEDVLVLGLRFESAGDTSVTADVRIYEVAILVADSLGAPIDSVFSDVTLADGDIEFGNLSGVIPEGIPGGAAWRSDDVQPVLPYATGIIRLPLATPIVLPVNTSVTADLRVSVLPDARAEWIRFRLDTGDSTLLPKARDVGTDAPVAVDLAAPFDGPAIRLTSRASGLVAAPIGVPNASVFPGAAGVPLLSFSCRHPGEPGEADVALHALTLQIMDDLGAPQVAGRRLLSLTAFADGVPIGTLGVAESDSTRATIPIPLAASHRRGRCDADRRAHDRTRHRGARARTRVDRSRRHRRPRRERRKADRADARAGPVPVRLCDSDDTRAAARPDRDVPRPRSRDGGAGRARCAARRADSRQPSDRRRRWGRARVDPVHAERFRRAGARRGVGVRVDARPRGRLGGGLERPPRRAVLPHVRGPARDRAGRFRHPHDRRRPARRAGGDVVPPDARGLGRRLRERGVGRESASRARLGGPELPVRDGARRDRRAAFLRKPLELSQSLRRRPRGDALPLLHAGAGRRRDRDLHGVRRAGHAHRAAERERTRDDAGDRMGRP